MVEAGSSRRKFPRRSLKKPVGVLARGTYFVASAGELGEGGMSFTSDMIVSEGSLVVLNFQIPNGDFVTVRAEVKSSSPVANSGVAIHGLAFLNMSFAKKRQIRAFVSARTQDQ